MSSTEMNSTEWSFWRFLKECKIEIPIIQRDYAQGRVGKEELRKSFLRDLKGALGTNKQMKLDFVYGTNENGVLIPLDGQQRLTTLWLLHWYVAYRAQKLDVTTIERLRKFSYKTRVSSRQFCEKLAGFSELPPSDLDVASHIKNQIWFRRSWQHDPTIQSMLRMLGGSLDNSLDGIDGVFKCHYMDCLECRRPIYDEYWKLLTSDDCPIVFHHIDLFGIRHPDSLYIKMNARGKPLTSFENFKADLVDHIARRGESEKTDDWKELANLENGFVIKFERDWLNKIFWPSRIKKGEDNDLNNGLWDGRVDDIAFAFFNRFCANEIIVSMDANKTKFGDCPAFDYFYGRFLNEKKEDSQSDSRIAYTGFSHFVDCLGFEQLKSISRIFDGYSKEQGCYRRYGDEFKFVFVPQYIKKNGKNNQDGKILDFANTEIPQISEITQKGRIFFYAFCAYFANPNRSDNTSEASSDSFDDWMRVVWNIVENSDVNTIDSMIRCMKLIHEFAHESHQILSYLKGLNGAHDVGNVGTRKGREQVAEEIAKAKKILWEDGSLREYEGQIKEFQGKTWKQVIDQIEQEIFFKGAIRFLFTDNKGDVYWDDFDIKYLNAKEYFDVKGVKECYKVAITRAIVLACEKWNGGLHDNQIFNPDAATWKKILCDKLFANAVHCIFVSKELKDVRQSKSLDDDQNATTYVKPVLEYFPFRWVVENVPEGRLKWPYYGRLVFYKPYSHDDSRKIIFDWENFHRNCILNELVEKNAGEKIIIDPRNIIKGCNCFVLGWDMSFKYKNHWFRWLGSPNYSSGQYDIYLLKEEWKDGSSYAKHGKDTSKEGDEQEFFCFNVNTKVNDFKTKLQKLITVYTDSVS